MTDTTLKDLILFPFGVAFFSLVFFACWIYLSCDWIYKKIRRVNHD